MTQTQSVGAQASVRHCDKTRLWLYLAVIVALVLRVLVSLPRDGIAVYQSGGGGDEAWYLANGYGLMSGVPYGEAHGILYEVKTQPGAVAYLIFLGLPQMLFEPETAARLIWIMQAAMSAALCVFAYHITRHLTKQPGAALIAAWAIALHPSLILAASYIVTETLFLFLVGGTTWLYVETLSVPGIAGRPLRSLIGWVSLVGLICGAATLTRAVFILFPLCFALHLLWQSRSMKRRAVGLAAVLLISYTAMTLTWTIFLSANYGRFVIVSTQFMPAVWRGVVEEDGTPEEMDAALQTDCVTDCGQVPSTQVYTEQVTEELQANLSGLIVRRAREWLDAVLVPYPAAEIGGESLRALVASWIRDDRSVPGLGRLIQGDYFGLKLAFYLFHYGGILFGLIGLWMYRRNGAVVLILSGFLLYTYAIHTVLLAIPRYIFPSQLYWWCAAAAGLWGIFARRLMREDNHANRN